MKWSVDFLEKRNHCKNRVALRPLAVHPLALIPLARIPPPRLRYAKKRRVELEARQTEMSRDCLYFSLALDTAQFCRDHFLSCVCRFGFDDCIFHELALFDQISAKTGRDLARFVFEKLNAKNCDFSKMVSITTDGAKNMIGQYSGMANEMVKIVNKKWHNPTDWS